MAQIYLLKFLVIHLTLLPATDCRIIIKRDIPATSTIPPGDELPTELPTTAAQLNADASNFANYANYSNYDHHKSKTTDSATPSTVASTTNVTETKKHQMADEQR